MENKSLNPMTQIGHIHDIQMVNRLTAIYQTEMLLEW